MLKRDNVTLCKQKDFKTLSALLYLLPALSVVVLFVFYPFSQTIFTSLHKTNVLGQTTSFVGLGNYTYIFQSPKFLSSLTVTLKFAVMVVFFSILIAFVLAVISNEAIRGQKFFRLVFSITMAVSSAAAASVFSYLFHPSMGMLNAALGTQIQWLQSADYALISVAAVTIWLNTGMFYIFMLSGMQTIPQELYESAEIDGAGFFNKHYHITLPCVSPTLLFLSMIGFINSFQSFAQVRLLTQGGPANSTNVIMYLIYSEAFFNNRFSRACAMAVVLFVILFFFSFLQFRLEKKVEF